VKEIIRHMDEQILDFHASEDDDDAVMSYGPMF
jgi:hypothetical protein